MGEPKVSCVEIAGRLKGHRDGLNALALIRQLRPDQRAVRRETNVMKQQGYRGTIAKSEGTRDELLVVLVDHSTDGQDVIINLTGRVGN